MRAKSHTLVAFIAVACSGIPFAAPNNPPNLTITGERYSNPTTYLVSGTATDESPGVTLVYRIKGKQTEVPLNGRKNWRLRIKLRHIRTRLVFFAIDRQGRRSSRQKRVLVQQPAQDQQQPQRLQESRWNRSLSDSEPTFTRDDCPRYDS